MMKMWLFSALFLLMMPMAQAGQYCGPQSEMGHWVPDEFATPMNNRLAYFGRACAVHDACYQSKGVNREFCDAQFGRHLRYECDLAYPDFIDVPSKLACYGTASGFTAMVRQFGNSYFERSQTEPSLFYWRP